MRNFKSLVIGLTLAIATVVPTAHAAVIAGSPGTTQQPLYRMYNQKINDHLYTTSYVETVNAEKIGYVEEGVLGYLEPSQLDGTKNVIRMWDPKGMKHFYTTDNAEATYVQQHSGFVLEGIIGYIQVDTPPTSTTNGDNVIGDPNIIMPIKPQYTLYRMYNYSQNKHFYTTNSSEMNSLLSNGYKLEGDLGTLYSVSLSCSMPCPL